MPTDRRAGKGIAHVAKQPGSRNKDGSWRKKRSVKDRVVFSITAITGCKPTE